MREPQYSLDISTETCPLTFVKTKLLLERMHAGEVAEIRLAGAEPLDNVPRSLRDQGHAVLSLTLEVSSPGVYRLIVEKKGR